MTPNIIDSDIVNASTLTALIHMDPMIRARISDLIAGNINLLAPRLPSSPAALGSLDQLRRDGIIRLGQVLSKEQCAGIVAAAKQMPCYAGHVPAQSDRIARPVEEVKKISPYASYKISDAIKIPDFLQLAASPELLGLADQYFGCAPTIYSVNLFWTFQGLSKPASTHIWHRDIDDFNFLALFVYLTDVDEQGGKFQFIKKSHTLPTCRDYLQSAFPELADPSRAQQRAETFFPPLYEEHGPEHMANIERDLGPEIEDFIGPAGTVFLADTYGLHRGSIPFTQDRLVCWIRFGLVRNLAYITTETNSTDLSLLPHVTIENDIPWSFRHLIRRSDQ